MRRASQYEKRRDGTNTPRHSDPRDGRPHGRGQLQPSHERRADHASAKHHPTHGRSPTRPHPRGMGQPALQTSDLAPRRIEPRGCTERCGASVILWSTKGAQREIGRVLPETQTQHRRSNNRRWGSSEIYLTLPTFHLFYIRQFPLRRSAN